MSYSWIPISLGRAPLHQGCKSVWMDFTKTKCIRSAPVT